MCRGGTHSWELVVTRALLSAGDKCWFQDTEGLSSAPPTLTTTMATQAGGECVVRAPAGKGEFQNVPRAWPQAPDTRSWRCLTPSALRELGQGWGLGSSMGLRAWALSVLS